MRILLACFIWFVLLQGHVFAGDRDLVESYRDALKPRVHTKGIGSSAILHREPALVLDLKFKINSYELSPEVIWYLEALGPALSEDNELRHYKYRVEGHTCNLGSDRVNNVLSQNRARAVANFLVRIFNLQESQFEVVGYGVDRPIADNATAEGRRKNRRVAIINTLETVEAEAGSRLKVEVKVQFLRNNAIFELIDNDTLTHTNPYAIAFIPNETTFVSTYPN